MSWQFTFLKDLVSTVGKDKEPKQPDLPFDPPLPNKSPTPYDKWPEPSK